MGDSTTAPSSNEVVDDGNGGEAANVLSEPVPSERIKRLFDLVPEIGTKWRWYDIPYRLFSLCLRYLPRCILPPVGRRVLISGINFLLAFNQHERNKVESRDDPRENLILPEHAKLRQGGLWTIELFPPSKYRALEESLRKNGWEQSILIGFDETNIESVQRARQGQGASWSKLVTIATAEANYVGREIKREELPQEFEFIELTAVQVGAGLTAVVAFFKFSECGQSSLDKVWRKNHEPTFSWQGFQKPRIVNRFFSAIEATQEERLRLHGLARKWLGQKCPGFFASQSLSHPVLDLNLFEGIDPAAGQELSAATEGLRALGMQSFVRDLFVSPEMPGAVLIPTQGNFSPHEPLRNCWAIAGEYESVANANERVGYGEKPYSPGTIGCMFNYDARSFLLYLAVMHYLYEQRAVYSVARDLAAVRHREFSIEEARQLSAELLESGLDLPTMARDCRQLWDKGWRKWNGIQVTSVPPKEDLPHREEFDLIQAFGERSEDQFDQLLDEDKSYRTVLSTTAALGASVESARIGKTALWVAGGSMAVAAVSLIMTEPGGHSMLAMLADCVGQLISWFVGLIEWSPRYHPAI